MRASHSRVLYKSSFLLFIHKFIYMYNVKLSLCVYFYNDGCVCLVGDSQSDWGARVRQYERNASAVAGARRYAAEVTDRSQRALRGSRQYAAEAAERSQRPWNGRHSYADSSVSSRHLRSSDPVGWSLLNSASADVSSSSSSSVWESSSYMSDLHRRRRRQLRMASPSSWSNSDYGADQAGSPPPSWQTQSLHGTQPSTNIQRNDPALSLPPFSRRRSSTENIQQASNGPRPTLPGPVFHETSSLADVDLWPSSRRERDGTSFTPIFVEDIENDAEEITSTGAEAGSTASIGGDTESIDADAEVRSADFELGSIGAEVLVSSGSGAEIGVIDPPSVRSQYESADYGPSTSDMAVMPNLRSGSGFGMLRTSERLAEYADLRDRASQRRWRRFNQADLQDRGSHHSSSAAAYNGSLRISDWLEFERSGESVPQRLPQRRDGPEFLDWNLRERDTSAAADIPRLRDYVAMRSRRGRPPYSGSGAASTSASYSHECLPNCEICNGGPGRLMQPVNRYMSELPSDHHLTDSSSRTRPYSLLHETLAPAASAVEDEDSVVGSMSVLQQEMETNRNAVPTFPWRESSASSVDAGRFPAAAEFERRVRRLDERVSQMQRRMALQADREPQPASVGYLREQQDTLHSHLEPHRSHSRMHISHVSESPAVRLTYDDDLVPSESTTSGYGGIGADAVTELMSMGQ